MKKLAVAMTCGIVTLTMAGCAQTQRLPKPSDSAYRPVNEPAHGSVKYFQAWAPSAEEMHREAAYEQAYKSCGGSYAILREWEDYYYNYFDYECVN
jgi:hypothetical protein